MAILLAGALLLSALTTDELDVLAERAGVDPIDLAGAASTTGLDPLEYLYMTGELQRPKPVPARNSRVECVIWHESRGNPNAVNRRSGASGLGQFLPGTWRTTPQGKAGYSVFNAEANRNAVGWMLNNGRAREFEVITRGLC